MRIGVSAFGLLFLFTSLATLATPLPLYDGGAGRPSDMGWLYLTDPLFGSSATRSWLGNGTRLQSPLGEKAGWFGNLHPALPNLPVSGGFAIDFTLKLFDEVHGNPDRAGFSVIVLNEAALGVELGFWNDRVWAQNDHPLFTHGEEALFDTGRMVDYRLSFNASGFLLSADGGPLLSGPLRDYSAHSNPIYQSANQLFLGDDTDSAGADAALYRIAFDNGAPLPAPGVPWLWLAGLFALGLVCRDRRMI